MQDEINIRLFRAAARGSLAEALLSIEAGADLNSRDYNNHTALQIARTRNHVELADKLDLVSFKCGCEGPMKNAESQKSSLNYSKNEQNCTTKPIKRKPIRRSESQPLD